MEKLAINNNLSSCHKNSLISKKKEKNKIIIKKRIKINDNNNNNFCLSDRGKNKNSKSKDTKDNKDSRHKRHYNKDLMGVCGKIKNSMEKGKTSTETKEN